MVFDANDGAKRGAVCGTIVAAAEVIPSNMMLTPKNWVKIFR